MTPHDAHDDREEPGDSELRAMLRAWPPPEPRPEFVEDTLLRIQVDALATPPPSPDFVDRVLAAAGRATPERGAVTPTRTRARRLQILGAMLAAAAVLVAVLPELTQDAPADLPPAWASPLVPSSFPAQGALSIGRSVALVRASIPAVPLAADGLTRQDRLALPTTAFPAPPPILIEAGLLVEPEPWDTK